ncbi:hypothetical protein [Sulfurirhabdus autotrophica]|uniref:Uncharacterized protein n=1 Tax=Sulfurirhabdus autotrophica TaxID=1706046 RepID=A0A4V6P3S4_9PROT|nr:hypothetical protein [Sulfurirhabdus autotrophica]TCV81275.1 hypothetical protein EDC63_12424 [Sulfurirhabdus autotrophica]
MKRVLLCIVLTSSPITFADYYVIGQITGPVCRGIGIELCETHNVDAVEGKDGKLFAVNNRFNKVDEYRNGKCWIKTKVKSFGLFNFAANAAVAHQFYEKQGGELKKIDVDSISFKCVER